ncbi:MAG: glycine zipper family protein, partial [Desulfurococcaceae archaeon]
RYFLRRLTSEFNPVEWQNLARIRGNIERGLLRITQPDELIRALTSGRLEGLDDASQRFFQDFLSTGIGENILNLSNISPALNQSFEVVNSLIRNEAVRQYRSLEQSIRTAQHTFTTYAERIRQPILRGIDFPSGSFDPEWFNINHQTFHHARETSTERLRRYINVAQELTPFLNPDLITPTEALNNLRENLNERIKGRLLEINSSLMRIAQQYNIQGIDFQSVEAEINRGNIINAINNLRGNIFNILRTTEIPLTQRDIAVEYFSQLDALTRRYELSERIVSGNLRFTDRMRFMFSDLGGTFHNLGSMMSQMYLFTGIFGLTMPLYYQLSTLPMMASQLSTQPFINAGLSLFGLPNFLNIFTSFPQMIPSIMVNMQDTITSMSSLFGSQQIGRKAVETALEISKVEPIQFQEALDTLLTGAIYPELRYKILKPEVQKSIFNTAQMLATLVPEQGIEGALFAIRELFGGQYRSLQARFNIDIDLISQYAGITREQLRSATPEKILQYLEKALVNLMGGTEFLLARGFTFGVQLNNIFDTLTQAVILPLNQNSQQIAKIYEKMSDEQIKRLFPYLYERLDYNPEEVRKFLSFNASSPMGLLSALTSSLNIVLEEIFDKTGLGDIVSKALTKYAKRFISLTDEVLSELESVDDERKKDVIRKYVRGVGRITKDIVNEVVDALRDTGLVDVISGLSTEISTKLFQPVMNELVKVVGSEMLKAPVTLAGVVGNVIANSIESIFTGMITLGKEGDIGKALTNIINFAGGMIGNIGIMRYGFTGDVRALSWGLGIPFLASGLSGAIDNGIDLGDIVNLSIGGGLLLSRYGRNILQLLSQYGLSRNGLLGVGIGLIGTGIALQNRDSWLDELLTVGGLGLLTSSRFLPGYRGGGFLLGAGLGLSSLVLQEGYDYINEKVFNREPTSWFDYMIKGAITGGATGLIFGPKGAIVGALIGGAIGLGSYWWENRKQDMQQDTPEIDFSKLHDYLIPEREKEFMSKVSATATILPERLKSRFIADAKSRFSSTLATFYKSFEEFLETSQENLINIISEEHEKTSGGVKLLNKQKEQIVNILNANLSKIEKGMKDEELDKIIDETLKGINRIANITPTTRQSVRDLFYSVRSKKETESILTSEVEQQLLSNLGIDIGKLISEKTLSLIIPQPPIKPNIQSLTPLERVNALFKYAQELYSYEVFKRDFELDKIDLPIHSENKFLTPKDIPIYKSAFSGALGYAGKVFSLMETEFNLFGTISPQVSEMVSKIISSPLLPEYMIKGGAGFINALYDYAVLTGDKSIHDKIANTLP